MICPACRSENEMAYSVLAHSFICPTPECGLEVEVEQQDAEILLRLSEEFILV